MTTTERQIQVPPLVPRRTPVPAPNFQFVPASIPRPVRLAGLAALLGGLYALGALLPFWFLESPAPGVAFFPSAGLTLATMLLSPRRLWPLWLSTFFVAEFMVDVTHDQTVLMALGFALANTAEPLVGAIGVRLHNERTRPRTIRARMVGFLVAGAVIGPLVGAFIGATVAYLADGTHSWISIAWHWWLGDALGVLVVGTAILSWSRTSPYDKRPSIVKVAAFTIVAMAVTLVPALAWDKPLIYAVLAVLMWAALSGGTPAVATAGMGVAFAVDWAAVTGHLDSLVPHASGQTVLVYTQLFLAITLIAALTIAVEIADRMRAERILNRAEGERNRAELAVVTAAEDERRRIARETHDIVGGALNVMLLQAGAARRVIDRDADLARALLESIETAGRDAFADLDVALGLVDRSPGLGPGRGLSDLPGLVDAMQRAGIAVQLDITGEPAKLSTLVDWSAYRIVQEALTNIAKHASGAHAQVHVGFDNDLVFVSIVDDGGTVQAKNGPRPGQGLIGMRERVVVLGGDLDAGPQPSGGYAVRVWLPLRGASN